MIYDSTAKDACFVDGRPPEGLQELLTWAQAKLPEHPEWRLISARRKLGRTLFEIEEDTPSGPSRLIGKSGNSERAATLFKTLAALRQAGFAPPALHTVPKPVAFIAERGFVLQEKIPGDQVARLIVTGDDVARSAANRAAAWLARLHGCSVPATPSKPDVTAVSTWARDLAEALPNEAVRVLEIERAILRELDAAPSPLLPSHGDFHPMNIFIAEKRVTGIDIDKYALREPEADIGWFLMQTAAMGFFETGSFACTEQPRSTFVERYEIEAGQAIRSNRAALYVAMAFLRNLHFELVLLKTGRVQYADPFLSSAASAILEGNLHFES
jgi:aminoglycoside phosphotransferase (APT) family kinase protein